MNDLQETLYGDVPPTIWGGPSTESELRAVLDDEQAETRHRLQALHALRELGIDTATVAGGEPDQLLGVVINVPVGGGLDTLAAYQDGSARYINHTGAAIIWDTRGPEIDALVAGLLDAGRPLLQLAGRWEGQRPPLASGLFRISLLCGDGLHFGQGPMEIFATDPHVAPLMTAGVALMHALIAVGAGTADSVRARHLEDPPVLSLWIGFGHVGLKGQSSRYRTVECLHCWNPTPACRRKTDLFRAPDQDALRTFLAERLANRENVDAVRLDSWSFNRNAHTFFEAEGFEPLNVVFERRLR